MQYTISEHRHGKAEVPEPVRKEIEHVIASRPATVHRGSTKILRDTILAGLAEKGWPSDVSVDPVSKISVTSVKSRIGLCLQTGNMSRMYADLLKLQTLYLREVIEAGIIIVPMHETAKQLGENVANSDRLVRELHIFERVITIPLIVFGVGK